MNALLKPSRRNGLHSAFENGKVVLWQGHKNGLDAIRPSPPVTLNATNKPFAKTINVDLWAIARRHLSSSEDIGAVFMRAVDYGAIRLCHLNNPTQFSRLVVSYPRRTNKEVSFLHGHPPIIHHVSRNKIAKVRDFAIGHIEPRSRQHDSDCLISDGHAKANFTSAFDHPCRRIQP